MNTKTAVFSLPLTPANFTTNEPIIVSKNAAIIEMSCSGGSLWKEYIIDFDEDKFLNHNLIWVKLWNNTQKMINTTNVVSITPTQIVKLCVNYNNPNFEHNYIEMHYACNDDPMKVYDKYDKHISPNEYEPECFSKIVAKH